MPQGDAVSDRDDHASAPEFLLTDPADNVVIVVRDIPAGTVVGDGVTTAEPHRLGQKIARMAIATGEPVLRYGAPIGVATTDIAPGDLVHVHNVASTYLRATTHRGEQS